MHAVVRLRQKRSGWGKFYTQKKKENRKGRMVGKMEGEIEGYSGQYEGKETKEKRLKFGRKEKERKEKVRMEGGKRISAGLKERTDQGRKNKTTVRMERWLEAR